jgi:two-component system, chemotaxis family, protein-glutamate methylesterase/glutaminase
VSDAPLRVVVVEDSATQRAHLVRLLEADGDIEVVAEATDRADAISAVLRTDPDVVTMDLEMPGTLPGDELAGLRAVRTIMATAPVPILGISVHADEERSSVAMEALAAGAAEVRPRPQDEGDHDGAGLRNRVRMLSGVKVVTRRTASPPPKPLAGAPVVALGASTGGPPALGTVVGELRGIAAPILVVQHIHAEFVTSLVSWLATATGLPTSIAEDGLEPEPGAVYLAPAGKHMRVTRGGTISLSEEPKSLHMPSVDELFGSIAAHAGRSAVAALLTGMGEDGAAGLAAIRAAGGCTFAQDEKTSAVYGMPRAAARQSAADRVLPLEDIGPSIRRVVAGDTG